MSESGNQLRLAVDILFLVEDSGAANFVEPLVMPLKKRGWRVKMVAAGLAQATLAERSGQYMKAERENASEILAKYKPRIVVFGSVGNHNVMSRRLMEEARTAGCVTIGAVDARMNARERWRGGSEKPLRYAPDWLMVPDQWTGEEFRKLGYAAERIFVGGHPHYDYVQGKRDELSRQDGKKVRERTWPGAARERSVVLFLTEGSQRVREHEGLNALVPGEASMGRCEAAMAGLLLATGRLRSRPYLALRLHPKDRREDYQQWLNKFDTVCSEGPLLEMMYVSDLVVGMSTMALTEAVLLGRPVLSILGRPQERAWLTPVLAKYAHCVNTQNELEHALGELLIKKVTDNVSQVEVERSVNRLLSWLEERLKKMGNGSF